MDGINSTSKWIAYFLKYFSLYSFDTMSSDMKSFRTFTLCIQIGLAAWCTLISFQSFEELLHLMEGLDALNFVLYYVNRSLMYWLIIYEVHTYRMDLRKFWRLLIQINHHYSKQASFKPRCFLLILIVTPFVDVLFTVFAILNEQTSRTVQKFMMLIFHIISFNRQFFYLLHMRMIEFQLQKIEIELKNINNTVKNISKFHQSNLTDIQSNACNKLMENRFKWIRNYYGIVYEMSLLVNSIFGWSQLSFVLLNCHCSVTFLNFFYRQMNRKFVGFNYGLFYSSFLR